MTYVNYDQTSLGDPKSLKADVNFWTISGKANGDALAVLITQFNKEYPNITINVTTQGGYPDLEQKIGDAIPAGTTPNLAYCYPDHVANYLDANAVMLNFDSQAAKGMSSRYFDAPGEIKYNDTYTFNVSYTAVQQTVYEGASITISQDNDPDLLTHPARVTIVSPIKDPANTAKWIVFVMTAHLSYQNKEVYSRDFNLRADPVSVVKISAVGGQDSGAAVMGPIWFLAVNKFGGADWTKATDLMNYWKYDSLYVHDAYGALVSGGVFILAAISFAIGTGLEGGDKNDTRNED